MGPKGEAQSKQGQSEAPGLDADGPTESGEASRRTVFAEEAEAAAEARRRNSDRSAGSAAWITTRLHTGDWSLRRSRVLIVGSLFRPHVSRLDATIGGYAAVVHRIAAQNPAREQTARRWLQEILEFLDVCSAAAETGSPSPEVDKAWHAFLLFARHHPADWEEAAIEHANLAGMYVSAGNPEAAAAVLERALEAIAPDPAEGPPLTAPMVTAPAQMEAELGDREKAEGLALEGRRIHTPHNDDEYPLRGDIALGAARLGKAALRNALRYFRRLSGHGQGRTNASHGR